MINPLPFDSSCAKLTLLPGELSINASARSGNRSPTLTQAIREAWNERDRDTVASPCLTAKRKIIFFGVHHDLRFMMVGPPIRFAIKTTPTVEFQSFRMIALSQTRR